MRSPRTEGRARRTMAFAVKALEFEHACACMVKSGQSGKDCKRFSSSQRQEGAEPVTAL